MLTFAVWAADYPGAADPLADTDKDGITNLLEYALLADPTQPSPNTLPVQSVQSHSVGGVTGDYLTLTVTRRNDSSDLQYFVEFVPNLQSTWVANGTLVSTAPGSNGTVVETWRAPTPIAVTPNQYGRLRVVKP